MSAVLRCEGLFVPFGRPVAIVVIDEVSRI